MLASWSNKIRNLRKADHKNLGFTLGSVGVMVAYVFWVGVIRIEFEEDSGGDSAHDDPNSGREWEEVPVNSVTEESPEIDIDETEEVEERDI